MFLPRSHIKQGNCAVEKPVKSNQFAIPWRKHLASSYVAMISVKIPVTHRLVSECPMAPLCSEVSFGESPRFWSLVGFPWRLWFFRMVKPSAYREAKVQGRVDSNPWAPEVDCGRASGMQLSLSSYHPCCTLPFEHVFWILKPSLLTCGAASFFILMNC